MFKHILLFLNKHLMYYKHNQMTCSLSKNRLHTFLKETQYNDVIILYNAKRKL
jgi:hypothetical protein